MKSIKDKSLFFKALSEPLRLAIIDFLLKNESKCICEVAEIIKRDQSVAYRHIQILKNARIVSTKKIEKHLMCRIEDKDRIKKIIEVSEK